MKSDRTVHELLRATVRQLLTSLLTASLFASTAVPAPAQAVAIPAHIVASVTGNPVSPQFIVAQIDAAVERAAGAQLPPGTTLHPVEILPAPQPLERGFQTTFLVRFTVDAGNGIEPITATTSVDVVNADIAGFSPVTLAFRDDPERIVSDGVLSRTTIDREHPTRVYYYHQNMRTARRFCVVLSANGSVRTHVHVIAAAAGPNIDVMSVGHAVTKTFLTRQPHAEGTIVEVAGGRPYLTRDSLAGPGEGVVGSVDLRVLDGGPLTLTVLAVPPGTDPLLFLYAPKLPDDGHDRHGNFPLGGFAERIIAYTVGGPDAAYVYGRRTRTLGNVDPNDAGHDFGDYGVLQRLTFDLANPTETRQTVSLYERPLGGVVRSSFLVNGTLVDVGCVRVSKRYAVSSFVLDARAIAAIDVLTMTDGGSNYPLEIGVTSLPTAATIPPIAAPDGCFPKPANR